MFLANGVEGYFLKDPSKMKRKAEERLNKVSMTDYWEWKTGKEDKQDTCSKENGIF